MGFTGKSNKEVSMGRVCVHLARRWSSVFMDWFLSPTQLVGLDKSGLHQEASGLVVLPP